MSDKAVAGVKLSLPIWIEEYAAKHAPTSRKEMLERLGLTFEVIVPEIDERAIRGEDPSAYVERLARQKALAVADDDDARTVVREPRI